MTERGLSTLKYIRDTCRARLTPKNLDAILRIKINGPDELDCKIATDNKMGARRPDSISYNVVDDEDIETRKKYLLKGVLF